MYNFYYAKEREKDKKNYTHPDPGITLSSSLVFNASEWQSMESELGEIDLSVHVKILYWGNGYIIALHALNTTISAVLEKSEKFFIFKHAPRCECFKLMLMFEKNERITEKYIFW